MKIVITGSAGFIGFHLTKSLIQDGHEIIGIDSINNYYNQNLKLDRIKLLKTNKNFSFKKIDICDKLELCKVFQDFKPERVVNLAAQPGVRYSIINPDAYVASNLIGFVNILEACTKNDVEGLIYASSSSVYGSNNEIPFKEENKTSKPISLYGATKGANELIANAYNNIYGLKITGLRFFTVYGTWYRPDMAIYIFTDKINNGDTIKVFNHGKMRRDFTFIDDIVAGTKSAIEKNYEKEIFNLGKNKSEELLEVIAIIENELGKKAKIKLLPIEPGDVIETYANIAHSQLKLGYQPKISIQQGIPKFVNWFKDYHA